jgi:arylformamidase
LEKVYLDLTQEDLEFYYSQKHRIPDYEQFPTRWENDSRKVRSELECIRNISYGEDPLECFDLFPAGTNAPVHIFFHGGYWHSQDKDHFEFPAPAFVKNRITYVCANYPLCPGVSFSEQMHSCRKLLSFLTENIHQYVDAPKGFQLSGHSAGGQIAAMLASTNWIGEGFPTVPQIDSVLALSGVYDLNPILFLEKNKEIRLNQKEVELFSPILLAEKINAPLNVVVGSNEGNEFIRQAEEFAEKVKSFGLPCENMILEQTNHFSILDHFSSDQSLLWKTFMKPHS